MRNNASNPQEDCGHGGNDDWSDGQRGLTGGPAAGQAAFDVPHSEHEPQVEPERNPGGLLADERDVSGSDGEHEQATLCDLSASEQRADEQRGLDRFVCDFAEYGPKMDQPVPTEEHHTLPGTDGLDHRELPGTALAPSDFECLDVWANRRGYHPDDQLFGRKYKDHGEAMARAYALEQAARPRQYERGDR